MESQEGKWSFNNLNNEFWNHDQYDTKEEAEAAAIIWAKECGYTEVEVGECTLIPLPNYIDSDTILETLQEQYASEAGGEYDRYDLYDNVKTEDLRWFEEELNIVINAFHERAKIESDWFSVSNVYRLKIQEVAE